jgi:hypothetical protein
MRFAIAVLAVALSACVSGARPESTQSAIVAEETATLAPFVPVTRSCFGDDRIYLAHNQMTGSTSIAVVPNGCRK